MVIAGRITTGFSYDIVEHISGWCYFYFILQNDPTNGLQVVFKFRPMREFESYGALPEWIEDIFDIDDLSPQIPDIPISLTNLLPNFFSKIFKIKTCHHPFAPLWSQREMMF